MDDAPGRDGLEPGKRLISHVAEFDCHVSTDVLESILGLSHTALHRLEKDGKLKRISHGRWDLIRSLQLYCDHLRQGADNRGGADEQARLAIENALLSRARREAQELKNEELRARLADVAEVNRVGSQMFDDLRAALGRLPAHIQAALPGLRGKDLDAVRHELDRVLTDALPVRPYRFQVAPRAAAVDTPAAD